MGLGDWILASAQAKKLNQQHNLRCVFTDGKERFYEPLVFKNNPRIAKTLLPNERYVAIADYPGNRPYIRGFEDGRYVWDEHYKATPGELFVSHKERRAAPRKPYVLIEPNVKSDAQKNKDWGLDNWIAVSKAPFPFLQIGSHEKRKLRGIDFMETDFRTALGVLSGAALLVTTDGALHHAAAALGIPAVVIWGGFTSPENLGYENHRNLWAGVEPCGIWKRQCQHCRDALNAITPDMVIDAIHEQIATRRAA